MRSAILVLHASLLLVACGGGHPAGHPMAPTVAKAYPATRWVPAHATYVFSAPTVKQAQRSLRDVIESLGILAGVELAEVSRELERMISVDPLSADPLGAMGIDLDGGVAMFSEALSPTFVVHLTSPEQTAGFFDHLREGGLVTQSVIVEGTEIFTATLPHGNLKVSWAVSTDWLWVHFALPFAHEDATAWFSASHAPKAAGWTQAWTWATEAAHAAAPALVGYVQANDLIATFAARVPDAAACTRLLAPVGKVGISIAGDGDAASGRLTIDLGPAAASLAAAVLPVPQGFGAAAGSAPLAVQMNLDLTALRGYLAPCTRIIGDGLAPLDRYGVRAGRVVVLGLDPDAKSASGVVSLELTSNTWFANKLDDIPLRSTVEKDRSFGALRGHALAIPFGPTIEYVMTDRLLLAGVGEGSLARVVGTGASVPGPLAAIDIRPPGLSAEAWMTVLDALHVGRSKRFVERLLRWREGHISITVEGTHLVLAASGRRR